VISHAIVRRWEEFWSLGPEWTALLAELEDYNPFQTVTWLHSWAVHHRSAEPHVLVLRDGSDLVAAAPLVRSRALWTTLRPMASRSSDLNHPVVRPGYEAILDQAICELVLKEPVDFIDWPGLSSERVEAFAVDREFNVVPSGTHLARTLDKDPDAWLGSLGKSLRRDIQRQDRLGARIEWSTQETVETDLHCFLALHRRRWRAKGLPGAFVGRRARTFFDACQRLQRSGNLWLATLFYHERVAGSLVAFRTPKTVWFYQCGFDPVENSHSPGTALIAAATRRAILEGVHAFDFLRGDEAYKRRWMPDQTQVAQRLLRFTDGPRGFLAKSWVQLASQIEDRVRSKVEGTSRVSGGLLVADKSPIEGVGPRQTDFR
jgi:CelD/BcsL family acetyltransferase involved in cellulose biosynthesis